MTVQTSLTDNQLESLLNSKNQIDNNLLNELNFEHKDKNIEIYKGKDNKAFLNKDDAILSYFNIDKLYELNDHSTYSSLDDVANYINQIYNNVKSNNRTTESEKIDEFNKRIKLYEKNQIFLWKLVMNYSIKAI
ncbi:hypothetical protein [Mycoplasmopsis adleri]|uniref:hypothetical protein n=1 Tax=Mycoplasmopsis adleri TaxID=51362 RepID=UPI00387372B5